jgi:hypothetical protein
VATPFFFRTTLAEAPESTELIKGAIAINAYLGNLSRVASLKAILKTVGDQTL